MSKTVTEETYQYTELVYRDDNGSEVWREHQHDDHWYDTGDVREPTEDEIFDYYDDGDDDE